jgi:hypothetical protein
MHGLASNTRSSRLGGGKKSQVLIFINLSKDNLQRREEGAPDKLGALWPRILARLAGE